MRVRIGGGGGATAGSSTTPKTIAYRDGRLISPKPQDRSGGATGFASRSGGCQLDVRVAVAAPFRAGAHELGGHRIVRQCNVMWRLQCIGHMQRMCMWAVDGLLIVYVCASRRTVTTVCSCLHM